MPVVHDLVAHVHGRPELVQRQLDDLDRPVDPGTKAARSRQQDLQGQGAATAQGLGSAMQGDARVEGSLRVSWRLCLVGGLSWC